MTINLKFNAHKSQQPTQIEVWKYHHIGFLKLGQYNPSFIQIKPEWIYISCHTLVAESLIPEQLRN